MGKRTVHSKFLFNQKLPNNFVAPIIVGYAIKTPENLGSIIRLADNIVCKKVLFVDCPADLRLSKVKKTASSSYTKVNWDFCRFDELDQKIPSEYKWIAIETTSDSTNIYHQDLPDKVALIVGNEIDGISEELLERCDKIVHIPVYGKNTSLNVSHALAVALFEWQRKILAKIN